ncbi:MAG: hypothetical protein M3P26_15490, partial [Gemmatimonadota bacterium]|nr:hypothetical protein [Gemmatimonadota bacterium]
SPRWSEIADEGSSPLEKDGKVLATQGLFELSPADTKDHRPRVVALTLITDIVVDHFGAPRSIHCF